MKIVNKGVQVETKVFAIYLIDKGMYFVTLVYLLEVPPQIEVPLGKIANFKRAKMVNTS